MEDSWKPGKFVYTEMLSTSLSPSILPFHSVVSMSRFSLSPILPRRKHLTNDRIGFPQYILFCKLELRYRTIIYLVFSGFKAGSKT